MSILADFSPPSAPVEDVSDEETGDIGDIPFDRDAPEEELKDKKAPKEQKAPEGEEEEEEEEEDDDGEDDGV